MPFIIALALIALIGCSQGTAPGGAAPAPGGGGPSGGVVETILGPATGGTAGPVGGAPTADTGGGGMTAEPAPTDTSSEETEDTVSGGTSSGGASPGGAPPAGPAAAGPAADSGGAAVAQGTVSDTPITVLGSPVPFSPAGVRGGIQPDCWSETLSASLEGIEVAVKGPPPGGYLPQVSIKGSFLWRDGDRSGGVGLASLGVSDAALPEEETRRWVLTRANGCFFAELTSPPGRTARLASFLCGREFVADVLIPSETVITELSPCPPLMQPPGGGSEMIRRPPVIPSPSQAPLVAPSGGEEKRSEKTIKVKMKTSEKLPDKTLSK